MLDSLQVDGTLSGRPGHKIPIAHINSHAFPPAACDRIQKELVEISTNPPSNCSAGPKGDNLVRANLEPSGACARVRPCARGIYMRVTLRFASLRHRRPDENGGSARRDPQFSLRTPVSLSLILSSFLLHLPTGGKEVPHVCACVQTHTHTHTHTHNLPQPSTTLPAAVQLGRDDARPR